MIFLTADFIIRQIPESNKAKPREEKNILKEISPLIFRLNIRYLIVINTTNVIVSL